MTIKMTFRHLLDASCDLPLNALIHLVVQLFLPQEYHGRTRTAYRKQNKKKLFFYIYKQHL
jgi:hypothetical protein